MKMVRIMIILLEGGCIDDDDYALDNDDDV